MRAQLLCLALLPLVFAALEVRKEVHGGPEEFTIKIGYRWSGAGRANYLTVEDELPETLALLGGELVQKVKPPTTEWQEISYTIGASDQLVFTLQNRTYDINLPGARLTYTLNDNAEQRESIETNVVTLTISHPSIEGTWNASWLVFLVVWILPVAAAVLSIGAINRQAAPVAAAAAPKPKKN